MRRHPFLAAGLAAMMALPSAIGSPAQEAPAPALGVVPQAGLPSPKPKERPKPKLKLKPHSTTERPPTPLQLDSSAEVPAEPKPAKAGPQKDKTVPGRPAAAAAPAETTPPASAPGPPAPGAAETLSAASLPIACDPGKAVHYDGPKEFSLWVTRSGTVRVDNPLRPLTPVVTRVLQLVIGDRVATAYGPDLLGVRRGGSPAALEATLGGPIQWDATLGNLPDPLVIVADSGTPLAELRFKECGDAPAVKAVPVAKAKRGEKTKAARKAPAADQAVAPTPPKPSAPPPQLPQGAIPE